MLELIFMFPYCSGSADLIFNFVFFVPSANTNTCPNGETPPPNYAYFDSLVDGVFYTFSNDYVLKQIKAISLCFEEGSSLLKLDSLAELLRYQVIQGENEDENTLYILNEMLLYIIFLLLQIVVDCGLLN